MAVAPTSPPHSALAERGEEVEIGEGLAELAESGFFGREGKKAR